MGIVSFTQYEYEGEIVKIEADLRRGFLQSIYPVSPTRQ